MVKGSNKRGLSFVIFLFVLQYQHLIMSVTYTSQRAGICISRKSTVVEVEVTLLALDIFLSREGPKLLVC